jgi:hypothetical protein
MGKFVDAYTGLSKAMLSSVQSKDLRRSVREWDAVLGVLTPDEIALLEAGRYPSREGVADIGHRAGLSAELCFHAINRFHIWRHKYVRGL